MANESQDTEPSLYSDTTVPASIDHSNSSDHTAHQVSESAEQTESIGAAVAALIQPGDVVALIGERGREVREFIEENLGEGLSRSVVVVSPADDSPVLRIRAAFLATEIAESYRALGKNVLLLMDSLTRIAQAQRSLEHLAARGRADLSTLASKGDRAAARVRQIESNILAMRVLAAGLR